MATSFTPITVISTTSGHRNHHNHRNTSAFTASASSSGKWWTPLFGWSSDPDYIHNSSSTTVIEGSESVTETLDLDKRDECRSRSGSGSRFTPGGFTEEKAKQLRMKTVETNFHDVMYHSAIASRLASDVSGHNVDR
ncbi:hypothetical protein HanPI659440_Chr04g0140101 [Helianthus annuus]|nr:hypothetical protein HanOQP8_Chr04g0130291 [Helianthus annuus]KAJ0794517.1 hypothetical protein HanPI659440_Chr04g0140101 [Helianthus annuus]